MTANDLPKFFNLSENDNILYYISKLENFVLDIINSRNQEIEQEIEQEIDQDKMLDEEDFFDLFIDV